MRTHTSSSAFPWMNRLILALLIMMGVAHAAEEAPKWWDVKWPARKKITIDTSDKGSLIGDPIGNTPVLVRLHDGVFNLLAG